MKRIIILSTAPLILLLLVTGIAMLNKTLENAPIFVPGSNGSFGPLSVSYSYPSSPAPPGIVWANGARRGGYKENPVLYDIDKKEVLGELLNAEPVCFNQDHTKLLCRQTSASLKSKLGKFLNTASGNRIELQWPYYTVETYWVLDLRRGSAARLGQCSAWWRTEYSILPSRTFHFAFIWPNDNGDTLVCDLERDRLTRIKPAGTAHGWWDENNLLMRDSSGDLVLFNVTTAHTNMLFSIDAIAQSLRSFGLTNDAASLNFFSNWNGSDYDFYFTVGPADWLRRRRSFLIKVAHAGPSLQLLYRNYSTLLCGVLDATATHCLYVRTQSETNSTEGIVLRDLRDNTEVAIDKCRIGSYTEPHFYRGGILFCRHDELWSADLNGGNHTRLIPPPP